MVAHRDGADDAAELFYGCGLVHSCARSARTPTKIQHIATSARVEPERSIARGTVLRIKFFDVLIEASFMRNVAAREL